MFAFVGLLLFFAILASLPMEASPWVYVFPGTWHMTCQKFFGARFARHSVLILAVLELI